MYSELAQVLDLLDKALQVTIINILLKFKKKVLKYLREYVTDTSDNYIKLQILEFKNKVT